MEADGAPPPPSLAVQLAWVETDGGPPPPSLLAVQLAAWVAAGEAPAPFAMRREGALTQPKTAARLGGQQLAAALSSGLAAHAWALPEAERLAASAATGRSRRALYWARSLAYLSIGDAGQARRDARSALAYCEGGACWAAGHAAAAAAAAAAGAGREALVHAASALEEAPPAERPALAALAGAIAAPLPPGAAEALAAGGAAAAAFAEGMRQAALPEYLKARPKHYHYARWMRGRIEAACGAALPPPVVAKLLELPADDLDLLLTHPEGVLAQALEFGSILRAGGPAALAAHAATPLTWEEASALRGGGAVGLPLGYSSAAHEASEEEQRARGAAARARVAVALRALEAAPAAPGGAGSGAAAPPPAPLRVTRQLLLRALPPRIEGGGGGGEAAARRLPAAA